MQVSEQEIHDIKKFILQLNSSEGIVVVEGKRDKDALRKLGHTGKIVEFHKFWG